MAENDQPATPADSDPDRAPAQPTADTAATAGATGKGASAEGASGEGAPPRQPARKPMRKPARRSSKMVEEVSSTGHSWDGITEYDNPMPRWWLWTFYATIVWAFAYTIAYPAWPLIHGATSGVLGYTNRDAVAEQIRVVDERNGAIAAELVDTPLDDIPHEPQLNNYAVNAGGAIFRTWCAQCHGSGAAGARGYPNLLDNDWLWGGSLDDIYTTVQHGIRSPTDDDTRYSEMPRFGVDGLLDKAEIGQVSNYVLSLSGPAPDPAAARAGAELFADNCAACHGEDGTGDRDQGAPNLTDAIWLYGDRLEDIERIVTNGPFGVMPAWSGRLSEAEIRSVAVYIHQLGGGE